jgi:hypothetical protein
MLLVKQLNQVLFSFWLSHKLQLSSHLLHSLKLDSENETHKTEWARLKTQTWATEKLLKNSDHYFYKYFNLI